MSDYEVLKNKLKRANDLYYKESSPIMSDYEFDIELKKLADMEKQQGYADPDSPTQKPGSDLSSVDISNQHKRPMLSLENTYNKEEVQEWYESAANATGNSHPTVDVELKYDGGSAAIRFKNGKIIKALTRGDGNVGEDITRNVQCLSDLSHVNPSFSGEVRGELIMTKKGFDILNKNGEYQNARNLLSGSMKLLDINEFKKREKYIRFYAYWNEEDPFGNHYDNIGYLQSMGFRTAYIEMTTCHSYQDIMNAIDDIEKRKPSFDIEIDGAVMKLDNTSYWSIMGSTAKFPRWAKAYKYKQESAETKITNITFEVGRSGKITPLAWFEPVFIDGSTIQKATLNNKDFYEAMDVAIGDVVTVQKAAAIIPQIIAVEHMPGREIVPFPKICPCCRTTLTKHNEEHADWYCDNINCKARVVDKIVNYTHMLEIDGFAEVLVERMHDAGILDSIEDLYRLQDNKAVASHLDRLSVNIVDKLIKNINVAKSADFWKCLAGLGIPNVGPKMAKSLSKHFKTIDKLSSATIIELMDIPDIAEITAQCIYDWFHNLENIELINFLKSVGQNLQDSNASDNLLNGTSFCITGALSMPRDKYIEIIENLGGKVVSGVTKKTNYLVTNDTTTMTKKNIAAKELGIPVIDENKLKELLHL